MAALRVLFLHGLESGPSGTKAKLLAERFEAHTPAMDTRAFDACVAQQATEVRRFRPDVVVGSSFGGAVALALLQRGHWRGPTLLLAPAVSSQGLAPELPQGPPVWIVHGKRDEVVPIDGSRALARSGDPSRVRLLEVDDDHALRAFARSGELVARVQELGDLGATTSGPGRHLRAFVEDAGLRPVLYVLLAHVALVGAVILLGAWRTRSPIALGLVLLLAGMSADAVWRARARGGARRLAAWLALFWVSSAVVAAIGARLGVL